MKTRILYVTIFALCLLNAGPLYAQEILTWQECIRQAKENNPDLISAAEKTKQAIANKDIVTSPMLPQITTGVSGRRSEAGGQKTATTSAYSVTGRQLVFDGFKTLNEVSSSSYALKAQRYDYAVVSSDVRLGLRYAFVSLLRAQDLIFITEDIAERRRQNLSLVKLRYETGREHKGALLTADADLSQAEFEIARAKRSISLAQRELSKELGLDKMRPMQVKGNFLLGEDYSFKPGLDLLADTTPFLQELIARKEAARYNFQSAKADFFPKIYLNGSIGKTAFGWPPKDRDWSAGLSLSFPLFEGGSRLAQASKANSQWYQAMADEQSGRDSVLVTLEKTWKNLQDAKTNVSVQKKFLEATEERAKISRAQYSIGLTLFDNWIIIEDDLVRVKKAYLDIQADMLVAEAYWIQAIGGTLEYDEE